MLLVKKLCKPMQGRHPISDERDWYSSTDSPSYFQMSCQEKKYAFLSLIHPPPPFSSHFLVLTLKLLHDFLEHTEIPVKGHSH